MSLRSLVKRSKAASMADVSVLPSTTKKFFWLSGGWVTCCTIYQSSTPLRHLGRAIAYAYAREQHARASVLQTVSRLPRDTSLKGAWCTHLIADNGEKLSVLVLRCRCCHGGMCLEGSCSEVGAWLGKLHAVVMGP